MAVDPIEELARQVEPHLRLEHKREEVEVHYRRLEAMREHPGVSVDEWDRAEYSYQTALTELDGELEELGLVRTDDLDGDPWYEPISQQPWNQVEPWSRDDSRGLEP